MKDLKEFLKQRKLLVLATTDEKGNSWTCNLYYSADEDLNLFFVSAPDTKHSRHLENNPNVSFSIPWFDENNLSNRKAIQGTGVCKRITSSKEIIRLLKNHYKYYPLWKDVITHKAMLKKTISSRPYVIKPTYMKFWNDELFGEERTKEFKF